MWNGSYESSVESLKRHLRDWKRRDDLSDFTICDEIAKAHVRIGGPERTGIRFEPGSKDEFNRQKAIAARINRLLTDEPNTDGEALALVNMLPSILAALPADLRLSFLTEYLAPIGLGVYGIDADLDGNLSISHLASCIKEDSEAHQAIAEALQCDDIGKMKAARKEIREAIEAKSKVGRVIDSMIRAKSATGRVINAVLHPRSKSKQPVAH